MMATPWATTLPRQELQRWQEAPAYLYWALPLFMLGTIGAVLVGGGSASWLCALILFATCFYAACYGRWIAALSVYFTYTALEGMFKYTTDFSTVVYALKPLLIVLMASIWWLGARSNGRRLHYPPLTPWLVAWVCVGVAQSFHPMGGGPVQSLATMFLWYVGPTFFLLLAYNEIRTFNQARQLLLVIMAIGTVVSLFAIVQFVMGQTWVLAHLPGYANTNQNTGTWSAVGADNSIVSSFRPASTTAYAGIAAAWSFIAIMMSAVWLLMSKGQLRIQMLSIAFLLLNVVGVLVIGVRLYVVLSIACLFLLMILIADSPRTLARSLAVLTVFSVIAWIGYTVSETVSGGILQARYGETLSDPVGTFQEDRGGNLLFLPKFLPHYPLGIGFWRLNTQSQEDIIAASPDFMFNRETQFNAIGVDLGLPGLIVIGVMLFKITLDGWQIRLKSRNTPNQLLSSLLFVFIVAYLVACLATPALQSADFFWLLAALIATFPALKEYSELGFAKSASPRRSTSPRTA